MRRDMLRPARILLIGWEVVLVGAAIALLANGLAWAPLILTYAIVNAGIVVIVLVLERPRYRSEAEETGRRATGPSADRPPPGLAPSDEVFIDPTTGDRVRVWVDAASGERRYRPDHD